MKVPKWAWYVLALVALIAVTSVVSGPVGAGCPGSQIYCPGVGCVSGPDKCFAGNKGGPSAIFSKETFVSKSCPGGTRSDGPCLMDFPDL
jgi:hypothetical protein